MPRILTLLLLVAIGWAPLSAGDAEQARGELQRAPVEAGRFTEDQLALAMHVHAFGAQAPRADLPMATLPAVVAAATAGDKQAVAEMRDRWFLRDGLRFDGVQEAHARRCPPVETCLQLWTMWNHLPPGRTKARWLPILQHALSFAVDGKGMATVALLLGDEARTRLRQVYSNGFDAFGDWDQARGDPVRRHDMLVELLAIRSQGAAWFPDEFWLDALLRSDLDDARILDPLLRILLQNSYTLKRLARLAGPEPPLAAIAVRVGMEPMALVLRACARPDEAAMEAVAAGLAVPLVDGSWEGYPQYWRHPSKGDDGADHLLRLVDHSVWRDLWQGPWRASRDATARAWAAAMPQLPDCQAAQLFSMLPPASRLDDPLLLAGLAHREPRVRMLAALQAARLDPQRERLEACFDLWEQLDTTAHRYLQEPWLRVVGLAVRQVAQHDDARLRARLQRTASADALLEPDLAYDTASTLSAWRELLGIIGLPLPTADAIDRFMRARDPDKYLGGLDGLSMLFLADQPDPDRAIARLDGWPLPMRMHALALAGRYDAALALWDAAPEPSKSHLIRPLLWCRRTEAMVKADPDSLQVLLGWAERQGLRPFFDPEDMGSRFQLALYQRLVQQGKAPIPWSDWRHAQSYQDYGPLLMLDGQRVLQPDDLPRFLEVLAKRGRRDGNLPAVAAILRRHAVDVPEELVVRSAVCAELRFEVAFQDGAWEEVLRRAEALPPLSRKGLPCLRRAMAMHRLGRLDGKAIAELLPGLEPFQRTLLAEWLLGVRAIDAAKTVAAAVADDELEDWQRLGWCQARIRLALAAGAPATALPIHAAAYGEARCRETWAHLDQLGELIRAADGPDAAPIAAWAMGGWREEADDGVALLDGWRSKAVSPVWKRTATWALAAVRARAGGGNGKAAVADWQELAEGRDWWAQLAKRSLTASGNDHRRLSPLASWRDWRRLIDSVACTEPMFGLALDPDLGRPPAIGERALMIDPWGAPELLYRRELLGPWGGWWLYLDGYRPMVRHGTWLLLARVDGAEELHALRLAPVAVPQPGPPPAPAPLRPPPMPPLPGVLPLILRLPGLG